jgi:hypothetical protein
MMIISKIKMFEKQDLRTFSYFIEIPVKDGQAVAKYMQQFPVVVARGREGFHVD